MRPRFGPESRELQNVETIDAGNDADARERKVRHDSLGIELQVVGRVLLAFEEVDVVACPGKAISFERAGSWPRRPRSRLKNAITDCIVHNSTEEQVFDAGAELEGIAATIAAMA